MTGLLLDLRHAARALRRAPAFTATAVLSASLGIGAATALFSVGDGLLLRPLPAARARELVGVYMTRGGGGYMNLSYPEYLDLRGRRDVFAAVVAHAMAPLSIAVRGEPERTTGELVSGDYFGALGVRPLRGRFFTTADAAAAREGGGGAEPLLVISQRLWERRFNGDPAAVGATVKVNGQAFTVIGVAPESFPGTYTGLRFDAWVPITMHDRVVFTGDSLAQRDSRWLNVIARLAPGVKSERATTVVRSLARQFAQTDSAAYRDRGLVVVPEAGVHPALRGPVALFVAALGLAVGLLLLIACVNVAGLLLVRGVARRREIGIRACLGAPRARIVRALLAESLLLALLAGAAGLALAAVLARLLATFRLSDNALPVAFDFSPDIRVVSFAGMLAAATTVLFGLLPALEATRGDLAAPLRDGTAGGGRRGSRLRSALVVTQVALSFVLLVGAGLLLRTLRNARLADPGFVTDRVVILAVDPELVGYSGGRLDGLYGELVRRAAALPGVATASLASFIPLGAVGDERGVLRDGTELARGHDAPRVAYNRVSPRYFETMQIPLVRGREFTERDTRGAPGVVIVNETLARRFWPGTDPLGQRLRLTDVQVWGDRGPPLEVVGVAKDVTYRSYGEPPRPFMYLPLAQDVRSGAILHVRTTGDPRPVLAALRREVRAIDPELPVTDLATLDLRIGFTLTPQRVAARILGAAGTFALLLASFGLYGVVAYAAAQRSREIAVRLAVGATRGDVARLVARSALRLTAVGAAAGIPAAAVSTRVMTHMLYGVSGVDPWTYGGAAAVLALVTLAAAAGPARGAMRLPPAMALRGE